MQPIILGNLHAGKEALLVNPYEPNLGPIHQYRDDKHIVYMTPIYEIKTPNRVTQDADAPDGGACLVNYDANMLVPFEVGGDEDSKVLQ